MIDDVILNSSVILNEVKNLRVNSVKDLGQDSSSPTQNDYKLWSILITRK